jgi:hypothetical protein
MKSLRGESMCGPDYMDPQKYEIRLDTGLLARIKQLQTMVKEFELLEIAVLAYDEWCRILDEDACTNWLRLIVDDENFHFAWCDGDSDEEFITRDYEI